jgi:CRISPR-associated endoribonuclease Cas6
MRLRITLDSLRPVVIPINYQSYLTGVVYRLLESSNADFSRFLHDEGFALDGGAKRFKLFTFSWLRGRCLPGEGDTICFAPPSVEWMIASPVAEFIGHCEAGLASEGVVRIASTTLPVRSVQRLPEPALSGSTPEWGDGRDAHPTVGVGDGRDAHPTIGSVRFTCLSPIVVSVAVPGGGPAQYVRPSEGAAFSEGVRQNLIQKYRAVHGRAPEDERFALAFDQAYLQRHGGTKKITYKNIDVIGAYAPFTVTGSAELMRVGLDCGFGEKNAAGFGMADVRVNSEE